jgi:hypothetical protein
MFRRFCLFLLILTALPSSVRAGALSRAANRPESDSAVAAQLESVRAAGLALASAGFRLSTANAALCDRLEPGHGIQLHRIDQYPLAARAAVRAHFRFAGATAVAGVVPGSPAEQAGVRADDTVLAFGPVAVPPASDGPPSTVGLVALWQGVAALPPTAPIRIDLLRDGAPLTVTVTPIPACRTRYELLFTPALEASANGEMVQISTGYTDRFGDELVLAVLAHELAHNILRHRDRLKAVGAEFGMLSGFGRNMGFFRQAELQADTLAVHLLARAGYPADLASRFRQHPVARARSGMFQSPSHPQWRDRLRVALAEEARIAANGPGAPFVAERDAPLTGDWRPLVPKP